MRADPTPDPTRAPAGRRAPGSLVPVLAATMLLDALEVSSAVVAAPVVGEELRLPPTVLFWVVGGFAAGFAAVLPAAARLSGRFGRRRVHLGALAMFALASAASAAADTGTWLVLGRVVKGACVALNAPTGLAIILATVPDGPARRRAVSAYSLCGAAGFCGGLLLAGLLTGVSWRLVLALPAPVALLLLILAARLIPRDPSGGRDARAVSRPVGLPTLWQYRTLVRAALTAATFNGAFVVFLLVAAWQLRHRGGWGPWRTAWVFLPTALPLASTALCSVRIALRLGPARAVAAGTLLALVGYLLFPRDAGAPGSGPAVVLPTTALLGAAFVLLFTALHLRAVETVPEELRPAATTFYQTWVQAGPALLTAPAAALVTVGPDIGPALWLVTAVAAVGALPALTGPFSPRPGASPLSPRFRRLHDHSADLPDLRDGGR
ncbi:MFS transporter [Streptomyces scabiei]|uniref:MFS transporter n=1 Tax=Streptomyces scabiei TaxID=1930 RepID=UPI00298F70D6|nr:MFS transporter [Streptomyces scabiei]MDW8805216.1 MFS transporter [Streptomyces scabiei]